MYIHESPCPYVSLVLKTARALDLVTLFDLEFHVFRPVMMKAPQYHCHPRKIILTGISSNKFLVSLSFPVGIAKYHRVPRPTIPFTHFIKQFPRIRWGDDYKWNPRQNSNFSYYDWKFILFILTLHFIIYLTSNTQFFLPFYLFI